MTLSVVVSFMPGQPDRDLAWERVEAHLRLALPEAEVVVSCPMPYTRARGLNEAIRESSGDIIVQCDPDSIVPIQQLRQAVTMAERAEGMVVPFDRFMYLNRRVSMSVRAGADPSTYDHPANCDDWAHGGVGNCTVYRRTTWERAKGYDERFGVWGGDDGAFAFACNALVGSYRRILGPMFHIWHPRLPESFPGDPEYVRQFSIAAAYRDACDDKAAMERLIDERYSNV